MKSLSPRLRLRKVLLPLAHRFKFYRGLSLGVSVVILWALPFFGLARVDLWRGDHAALGKPVDLVEGLAATLGAIALLYVITFASNLIVARMFCGWGCPIGQISRFGEGVEVAQRTGKGRVWSVVKGGAFGAAVSFALLTWWVHPAVFISGSIKAKLISLAVLAALVGSTYIHGRFWRWAFCRKVCPIGLYYSVVAPTTSIGIVFEQQMDTCIQCEVCAKVCPVDLDPRDLTVTRVSEGGLSLSDLPADNHCLRCGDCVAACEHVFRNRDPKHVPLHFGIGRRGVPLHAKEKPNG